MDGHGDVFVEGNAGCDGNLLIHLKGVGKGLVTDAGDDGAGVGHSIEGNLPRLQQAEDDHDIERQREQRQYSQYDQGDEVTFFHDKLLVYW